MDEILDTSKEFLDLSLWTVVLEKYCPERVGPACNYAAIPREEIRFPERLGVLAKIVPLADAQQMRQATRVACLSARANRHVENWLVSLTFEMRSVTRLAGTRALD